MAQHVRQLRRSMRRIPPRVGFACGNPSSSWRDKNEMGTDYIYAFSTMRNWAFAWAMARTRNAISAGVSGR